LPKLVLGPVATLADALIAISDRELWERYCRLAVEWESGGPRPAPVYAFGSVEWQRQQDEPLAQTQQPFTAAMEAAGRRRLMQRGAPLAFSGAPSPLGAAGGAAFDEFIARRRGPSALLAEIEMVEQQLVEAFEVAGALADTRRAGFATAPESRSNRIGSAGCGSVLRETRWRWPTGPKSPGSR
jgi:hypothetical protein